MIVVDENGNEISSTYVKRAKGLVKKGRARFIDENKICLTYDSENPCPPSIDLEDNIMDEKIIIGNGAEEMNHTEKASRPIEEIVAKIDAIASDKGYLTEAIESLRLITDGNSGDCGAPGDIAGQAKAQALGKAVAAREETNQRLIEFYTKVYNDLINAQMSRKDIAGLRILSLIENAIDKGMDADGISTILDFFGRH